MSVRAEFAAYFEEVHGHPPFPWQARLAECVIRDGWPPLLDLPTGVGKTCAIDVALFALSKCPESAPRRIFLVVDRRLIVDQAADHARVILRALMAGRAAAVARRLRALFGGSGSEPPFDVAVLRGGMPQESDWAKRPDRPVVALSTVDQVGSRLLFRGYGVSARMAPVHAGLVGNDALLLLDEVHLSVPFEQTLDQITKRWRSSSGLPARFEVVRMSATPGQPENAEPPFRLDEHDLAHAVLKQRLGAPKPTELEVINVRGDEAERRATVGRAAAARARQMIDEGARVVCVVMNRVDSARAAWRAIDGVDVALLTGRMRPLDRDQVLHRSDGVLARARAGRGRSADDPPLVICATQTIEAGADLDFDALITECASFDALKQRFGRLDRRGELQAARGVIVIRSDQVADSGEDPVYGASLARTWSLLDGTAALDLGVHGAPEPDVVEDVISPRRHAPIMLPAHIDSWAQTSPVPVPDPDIGLWLHGTEPDVPEVQIVWRTDLPEDLDGRESVGEPAGAPRRSQLATAILASCPPSSAEALAIPLYAARRWMTGGAEAAVADALGASSGGDADPGDSSTWAIRWAGDEATVIGAEHIRPGDTLVVPSTRGGLSGYNWDPDATDVVEDLGDRAQWARGRATLRLFDANLRALGLPERFCAAGVGADQDEEMTVEQRVDAWLEALRGAPDFDLMPEETRETIDALAQRYAVAAPGHGWIVLDGRRRESAFEASTETDDSGFLDGRAVSLLVHGADVRRKADQFVTNLALPSEIADDVRLAAWFHDVGKADPRFQRWLAGGSEIRVAMAAEPLAKSAASPRNRRAREEARARAGYPRGERHELVSLAMLERTAGALDAAHDPDLVLHLVASHHGWCRPFAPALDYPDGLEVALDVEGLTLRATTRHAAGRLDSGVSDRFWALTRRYGWWGLAWLEAMVRLADHRASEEEAG